MARVRRVVDLGTVAALDYSTTDERELVTAIDQARHPMRTVFLPVEAIDEKSRNT